MIHVAADVRAELARGGAVVALESTLVAHGLPAPENLDVARELEATVRREGAVPATVAVVGGRARVGLDAGELEALAEDGARAAKAGAADLAVHVARGDTAATTVSGTAFVASRAGVRVFATGGIGGVHRGDAGDVSSDLSTLAEAPIAVVSAGPKAILDVPRTLEALETRGVLVVGYRTGELPAFYTRTSGLPLEHRADAPEELAAILRARWALGQGGVLVANPIPVAEELSRARIDAAISRALADADAAQVNGKKLTPFVLGRLAEATGGDAVRANRALAVANAELAAKTAVAWSRRPR